MNRYKLLKILFLNTIHLYLLVACSQNDPNSRFTNDNKITDTIPYQDSTKLISSLYENKQVFPVHSTFSDFSYNASYFKLKKEIHIKSSKSINHKKISYTIIFNDEEGNFNDSDYSPSDESFKYLDSYFSMEDKTVTLKNKLPTNRPNQKVDPALIWYGVDFGISGKYYQINNRGYYLIRGLDLYCNGRQCNRCQLFIIRENDGNLLVDAFTLQELFPYTFESIFLFDSNSDQNPEIYITKEGVEQLSSTQDFIKFEITPSGIFTLE